MQIRELITLLIQQDPNDDIVVDTAEGTTGIEGLRMSQSLRNTVRLIPIEALLTEGEAEKLRVNAAGQDTKRLDWYLGASASPPSIEDWIRGMKEGWTPTQWRAWSDQHLNAEGRQG